MIFPALLQRPVRLTSASPERPCRGIQPPTNLDTGNYLLEETAPFLGWSVARVLDPDPQCIRRQGLTQQVVTLVLESGCLVPYPLDALGVLEPVHLSRDMEVVDPSLLVPQVCKCCFEAVDLGVDLGVLQVMNAPLILH